MINKEPYTRPALESILNVEHDLPPAATTKLLKKLDKFRFTTSYTGSLRVARSIYAAGKACADIPKLEQWLRVKDGLFDQTTIGQTGERYVRSLLIRAGFRGVSQRERLGYVSMMDAKADLSFSFLTRRGTTKRAFVEVKNCREVFHARGRSPRTIFTKLVANAGSSGAQPVLFAAHLSESARALCVNLGIAYLELGRQVLPNSLASAVGTLPRNVIGSETFYFVNPARPFRNGLPGFARSHVATLLDPDWLLRAVYAWDASRLDAEDACGALLE